MIMVVMDNNHLLIPMITVKVRLHRVIQVILIPTIMVILTIETAMPMMRLVDLWPGSIPPRQGQKDANVLYAKHRHPFYRRLELHFFPLPAQPLRPAPLRALA